MGVLIAADIRPGERVTDSALLIIDMQNDFVRVGAPLEVEEARATIPMIQRLADAFHRSGRPVIYTRFLARQLPDLMWLWSPQCGPHLRCCWEGTTRRYDDAPGELDCTAIIDELAPVAGDPVVDKYGYGSFHQTDLDARLKALGVGSLLVTGTVAQICVEETAREAFHHGYRTTMVSDAVSSFDAGLKAATLKNFAMKFGWVGDTATVLQWIKEADAQRAAARSLVASGSK